VGEGSVHPLEEGAIKLPIGRIEADDAAHYFTLQSNILCTVSPARHTPARVHRPQRKRG
jgi:hypothetical protein